MNINKKAVDMTNGPLFKNIIVYNLPIIITGLLQLLFNAADLAVVGHYCGDTPLAAVGSTGSLINLIVNLFMGLSVGVGLPSPRDWGQKTIRRLNGQSIPQFPPP